MLPAIVCVTLTRDAAGSPAGAAVSTRAVRGFSAAVTAPGRMRHDRGSRRERDRRDDLAGVHRVRAHDLVAVELNRR